MPIAAANATSSTIGAPEAKSIAAQTLSTSIAWPKSGCMTRSAAMPAAMRPESVRPGGPPCSMAPAISQAVVIAKAGFRNSDGCRPMTPSEYQRTAPLPKSVPNQGSAAQATAVPRNISTPRRRIATVFIIESKAMTPRPATAKTAWRTT